MTLTLIAAISENNVIGKNEVDEETGEEKYSIPWDFIPEDMKRFKRLTKGHPCLMGRKTYESLPDKVRPLPDRENIVLTRSDFSDKGIYIARNIEEALDLCKGLDAFVMGGSEIYRQFMPYLDRMEITRVHKTIEGDGLVYFPEWSSDQWKIVEGPEEGSTDKGLEYSFITYERRAA